MGCCLSTTTPAANHRQSKPKMEAPVASPPPAFEEETVKEVLSETPIVPPQPPPSTTPPSVVDHREILQPEEAKTESGGVDLMKNPTDETQENVSDVSEMYSYSESFSAATTATVTDAKKDEIEMEEVTQKVKNRSPPAKRVPRKRTAVSSGELAGRKDKGIRPPARRPVVPSPEKKAQIPSRTTMTSQRHRNVGLGPSNDDRRELPVRRSRSPAMRGEAGQRRKVRERSPAEKSGDRIPANGGESEGNGRVEKADVGSFSPEPETSESLENPLVSLECFIFL